MNKSGQIGDMVEFIWGNPGTNGTQKCYGNVIKKSKFKATVKTVRKYQGVPMKITLHECAFRYIKPEDLI